MSDPLDPSAVLACVPKVKLNNGTEGIAALLHAALLNLAFRLVGVNEATPATGNVLPEEWSAHPGNYTLRYRHDQSSLEFVLKVSKLGSRTIIHAIALESEKATSLDVSTNDFISPSFFPHDPASAEASPLVHGFISSNRVTDLLVQFKSQIVQKLIPGLRKEGYTEETVPDTSAASGSNPPPARGNNPPPPARPQQPHPVRDDYPQGFNGRNPYEIGRNDLDPFPNHGFAPPSLFPGGGGGVPMFPNPPGGDGMYVGPNHPIFGGGRGRGGFGGQQGPWGGDGYLPPMGAPPGARFDPVGPFGGPGFGGIGGRRGGRGGRMMGDPDNDEFMPPGNGGPGSHDMFS